MATASWRDRDGARRAVVVVAALAAMSSSLVAEPARAEDGEPAAAQPAAPQAPASPDPATPAPRSGPVAITIEALIPVGGAGCFYRRRYVPAVIVAAGSLVSGGTLIYSAATRNRDAAIVNAVAYVLIRAAGIAAAASPDPEPMARPVETPVSLGETPKPPPGPHAALPANTFGLSHAFAF